MAWPGRGFRKPPEPLSVSGQVERALGEPIDVRSSRLCDSLEPLYFTPSDYDLDD